MKKVVLVCNVGTYVMEKFLQSDRGDFSGTALNGTFQVICVEGILYLGSSPKGFPVKQGCLLDVPESPDLTRYHEIISWAESQIKRIFPSSKGYLL